jgi:hypothetical protein
MFKLACQLSYISKFERREQKLIPNIIFHIENLEKNLITITQRAQNSQNTQVNIGLGIRNTFGLILHHTGINIRLFKIVFPVQDCEKIFLCMLIACLFLFQTTRKHIQEVRARE